MTKEKLGPLVGKSDAMQAVYTLIEKAAVSEVNVVVQGESGTGKELVARTIHNLSDRKDGPFIAVNCGAIPDTLFEREFFGHKKGAFTGADQDLSGYFDHAHRGTLFLDEIEALSPIMQAKLLRVLQDGEFVPLGNTVIKKVDVRIIIATNQPLNVLLREGKIREDFYYRLSVIVISLPPLRDRKEDLPLLIEHHLEQYHAVAIELPSELREAIDAYSWPGNVRELENVLQRFLTVRQTLIEDVRRQTDKFRQYRLPLHEAIERFEKAYLQGALRQCQGRRSETARVLKINLTTLLRKMKKYGISTSE